MKRGVNMWNEERNVKEALNVKIGDRCHVEGNKGTVIDVKRYGTGRDGHTSIKVCFDEGSWIKNTVYDNGWYGSYNWAFTYCCTGC